MPSRHAAFWQTLDPSTIQCHLCPHRCCLKEGAVGVCSVRKNIGGQLILLAYGKSSGFAVDPIEKKPLYQFLPGSQILSFGTLGCNLSCQFCQNWSISAPKDLNGLAIDALPAEIAEKARALKVPSIAFTYNEPVVFAEYAMDTAAACHRVGVKTVAVTSGYISDEARPAFFENIDAANVDLKAFTNDFYKRLCQGALQPVLDTLCYLKKADVWLEITNLIIPGENDHLEDIRRMAQWIVRELGADVPLHFSAFHPDYRMRHVLPTSLNVLQQARETAMNEGLLYVYTGNVRDEEGGTTFCPSCRRALIRREGFQVMENNMKKSACPYCQAAVAGVF